MNYFKYYKYIPYFGGKTYLLSSILMCINNLARQNNAHTFIDLFGGSGKVAMNVFSSYPFKKIILNEFDESLVTLYRVMADKVQTQSLVQQLLALEYSKETLDRCKSDIECDVYGRINRNMSDIEKAAAAFFTCAATFDSNRQQVSKAHMSRYKYRVENLLNAHYRLAGITLQQGDAINLLKQYGRDPRVIKYLDPPYHPVTRAALGIYACEMSRLEHIRLVEMLCCCRGWILSGYDPAEYDDPFFPGKKCQDYVLLEEAGAKKVLIKSAQNNQSRKNEWLWIMK